MFLFVVGLKFNTFCGNTYMKIHCFIITYFVIGLTFNTFYGNKYSRAPDLLALANINPDAGYAVQMQIDETLEVNSVCFQAALLYTSSKVCSKYFVYIYYFCLYWKLIPFASKLHCCIHLARFVVNNLFIFIIFVYTRS